MQVIAACGSKVSMERWFRIEPMVILGVSGSQWGKAGPQGRHPKAANIAQGPQEFCYQDQAFNDCCWMLTGHTTYRLAIVRADPCPTDGLFKALLKPLQNPSLFSPDDSHPSHLEFSLYA